MKGSSTLHTSDGGIIAPDNGTSGCDPFDILIADADALWGRWNDIETVVRVAFEGAAFNDGYRVDRPLAHTRAGIDGSDRARYRHVLAEDRHGGLAGGWFRIAVAREPDEVDADPGWFFASSAPMSHRRREVADAVVIAAHELLKQAGFIRVVTNMGTQAGANFMSGRHGYVHEPTCEQQNRWVRTL